MFKVEKDGVITYDAPINKADIEEYYKKALGEDINTAAYTPEGQLIQVDFALVNSTQTEAVDAINAYNIFTAQGKALDSIARANGYYRKFETKTVVDVEFTGLTGTTIEAGFLISDGEHKYQTLQKIILDETGKGTSQAQCLVGGEIPCFPNTITTIVNPQKNVDEVTNPFIGVIGAQAETDNIFRYRILRNWLSIRSKTSRQAIEDNLAQLTNVASVLVLENYEDIPRVIEGIEMPRHSMFVCILGGTDEEIAKVLAVQKTVGADMKGETTYEYLDEYNNLYTFRWQRARAKNCVAKIKYQKNVYTPADIIEQIKTTTQAFLDANPFLISEKLTSVKIFNAISTIKIANILEIQVSDDDGVTFKNYANVKSDEHAVISEIQVEEVE